MFRYLMPLSLYCCMAAKAQDNPIVLDPNKYIVKSVSYDYDLISGKVNEVSYQGGEADQLLHRYAYDGDNRLTAVYTSSNGEDWTREAKYDYYAHGSLAKTVTGALSIDSSVYAYTLQGWIKGVRGEHFSYALGYNPNDYKAISAATYGGETVGL
ncbi:MAG TPA: hypothetical protein VL947_09330 [Cytophagales bacterium]|nr:hypothetical protein [Cytophagales bacterium]